MGMTEEQIAEQEKVKAAADASLRERIAETVESERSVLDKLAEGPSA